MRDAHNYSYRRLKSVFEMRNCTRSLLRCPGNSDRDYIRRLLGVGQLQDLLDFGVVKSTDYYVPEPEGCGLEIYVLTDVTCLLPNISDSSLTVLARRALKDRRDQKVDRSLAKLSSTRPTAAAKAPVARARKDLRLRSAEGTGNTVVFGGLPLLILSVPSLVVSGTLHTRTHKTTPSGLRELKAAAKLLSTTAFKANARGYWLVCGLRKRSLCRALQLPP
jgi:hypothetical protein